MFTATKGPVRPPSSWMLRAINSFPTPRCPSSSTGASEPATFPTLWNSSRRTRLFPTIRSDPQSSWDPGWYGRSREEASLSTFRRSSSMRDRSNGLVMNSAAPARVERAAASGRRTAVMM